MKIIADPQVRQYELTYLVPAIYTQAELSKINEEVESVVKKYAGKVVSSDDWGKKHMAYKIRHDGKFHDSAFYTHYVLEFESEKAPEFEKELKLNTKIMRNLLVRAE